jgi:integrase
MITLQTAMTTVDGNEKNLIYLRSLVKDECPKALKALRYIDHEYGTARKPKGYSLLKRPQKKMGYVYYVRYWYKGKMLPSKWNTHTNDYFKACEFAKKNREGLITEYLRRRGGDVERFFERFFDLGNNIYKNECKRNGSLSEVKRKKCRAIMIKDFVPFLKENRVKKFEEITVPLLDDFQDALLSKNLKAVSVNGKMIAVGKALKYLARKGLIKQNPYLSLTALPARPEEKMIRGCYDINRLKGVFDKADGWKDKTSFLLCLLIYTTDMRNSEIINFRKRDIKEIDGCRFIEIVESKTTNGIRLVPLHNRVYQLVMDYAAGKDDEEIIFNCISKRCFIKANQDLGSVLGVSEDYLIKNNITFYSGRHFWKTLMNAKRLGEDAEEIFMGHKVSSNVAKVYNHRDKQGKDLVVKKAKKVFAILDRYIFADIIYTQGPSPSR